MMHESARLIVGLAALAVCVACSACAQRHPVASSFDNFIRRDGDRLKDGDRDFRFISFNVPNLHYVEDDLRFDKSMPFRLPDAFEIDDCLGAIDQVGGQVVRTYALSVSKPDDPADMPRHILGPGKFNESAFVALDEAVAAANCHGVRLIIPLVDQWSWWGGTAEVAAWHGKRPDEFWTDPQVIDDYKRMVNFVVNRVNTVTGVRYRDDKAILGWETGNELKAPDSWTKIAAAHIRGLDPNHLVIDGAARDVVPEASLADPNIDFVQTHYYDKDTRNTINRIVSNSKLAAGRKPYHVGEFGFLGTESLRAIMDTVIQERITGALLWSMRYRSRDGGFYWHHEPYGGDLFKAYHWPGFEIGETFDERRMVRLLREKAFEIRGMTPPPLPIPGAPRLLGVDEGAQMSWQGSVGAESYDVQRSESPIGPWLTIGDAVSEAQVQFRPLFVDEAVRPDQVVYYRVIARNSSGWSEPSNVVGPVHVRHRTLVDELWNDSRIFLTEGKIRFQQNDARKFKEDCHRLVAGKGSAIIYYTSGDLGSARIFVFSRSQRPDVRMWVSSDCRNFEAVESQVKRTSTYGEAVYGYWKADRYSLKAARPGCRYLKIEFQGDAQLSRVEIDHG